MRTIGSDEHATLHQPEHPAIWDTGRWTRRAASAGALIVGAADLLLASYPSTPLRASSLDFDLSLDSVFGARYGLLLAGLVLVALARGLLHGKRNAWILAVASALASTAFYQLKHADLAGMLMAISLVVGLLFIRTAFTARSDSDLIRRAWQVLIVGEVTTLLYGMAGIWLMDGEFHGQSSLLESFTAAFRLQLLVPAGIEPLTRHGRWFIGSVHIAALAVALFAISRLIATVVFRPAGREAERADVEHLLDDWATTSLAYFSLLDDKSWIFAPDGRAFIAYKVVGTTAVALGGPIGDPSSRLSAAHSFVEHAVLNAWIPVFHQVTAAEVEELAPLNLLALKIGEEAIVDLSSWSLEDHHQKSIRSALRRVQRRGYHVVELPMPLGSDTLRELREVSDDWLNAGGHRERTFTLGRFDPDYLDSTRVLAVVADSDASNEHIVAFVNILPSYRSIEGNFDMMRRRHDAPNGAMELLFVGLMELFRADGLDGMNLGLAPLSGLAGDGPPDRALRLVYQHGGRSFNFEGLRTFKEKWSPRWEPRLIMYRRDTDLPRVAMAVARAGELPNPRSPWTRVRHTSRRFPVSLGILAITTWLMASSAVDPTSYRTFIDHLALGWPDLLHLQLWRLPTSQFLQTRSGWVLSNLLLAAAFLPLAESRLKSRLTLTVFFIGDWISTLMVLVGSRVAAALGNQAAANVIASRDGGLSSGVWALVGALVWGLPPKWRPWSAGALFAFLGESLIRDRHLFNVQHLLASATGIAIVMCLDGRDRRSISAGI